MRVKCIDIKSRFGGNDLDLTLNKEYEVIKLDDNGTVCIADDLDSPAYYCMDRFEIIKEDKMENRIVRKLEDLDGLENGIGLRINACDVSDSEDYKDVSVTVYRGNWRIAEILGPIEIKVKTLKAMGFKFEFQKLRTVDEVLEEMFNLEDKKFSTERVFNYYVDFDHNDNKYKVDYCDCYETLGAIYMSQETAQKYADELNEIVGCK